MKEYILAQGAPKPIGPYSQAIFAGDNLYCSGQIAIIPETGELAYGGVREQTLQIVSNIKEILGAAGLSMSDVVKTTCYLADIEDFAEFNSEYDKHFPSNPVRTCVAVSGLPKGALVEIEALAVR